MNEAEFARALRHLHTMIQLATYGPLDEPSGTDVEPELIDGSDGANPQTGASA